ncbi:hypothetical protein GE09DRAFT_568004 [Coniochaeta sp. 2T2.1]|nr:hypothetical protein GE09DRAFT_568004 [Coniochaeta sp. 2T2.1]
MNPGDVLTADLSTPALGPLTLEDCAAACSGYDFFGVEGGDSCYCGNDVDTTADLDAMSSCNVRCEGNDLQLCGGDSALKVYAVSARWNNEVYTSIQSTVISTPYPADSCTVGPTSTASGTSTQTTSSTTTTTGTTTETATASGSSSEPSTVESGTGTGVPSSTGDSSSTETDEPTSTGESSSTATDESSSTDASGSATATDASSGFASATEEPTSTDASSGSASTTEEPTSTGGSATETEEPTSAPSTTGGSETGSETSTVETATGGASTGTGSEEPTGTGTGGAAPTGSNTEEPTGTGSEEPTATGTEEPTSAPLTTGGSETGTDTFESSATSAPFGNSTDATAAPTGTDDLPTTTGFPTGTGASTSTTPSTPTAPPASEQFIFSVAPPVNATLGRRANPHRSLRNAKRQFQVGDGFVGGAGPLNPTDCTLATPFVFNADGTLTSGGEYVSTDPGIAYQPFWTNSVTGAITTTFAVQDGGLVWLNAAFVGGQAGFCQDINGLVWVTFDQNPPPFDCVAVVLIPFATSQCADTGTLVPGGPTTLPGPTVPVPAPTGTGGDTATVAPTVPIPSGTGTDDVTSAPTATDRPVAECYVRSESWVFGETTLLPRTTTVV